MDFAGDLELLTRIRREFVDLPGLRLTSRQAQRLWSLSPCICDGLLTDLVQRGFLWQNGDGVFLRRNLGRRRFQKSESDDRPVSDEELENPRKDAPDDDREDEQGTPLESEPDLIATPDSLSDRRRAASQDEEVAVLSHLRSLNLLLIGPAVTTREFLAGLMSSLATPVVDCDGSTPDLPNGVVGSLIVHNVTRLTQADQQQLLEWLDNQSHRARIIATSTRPVFPRVERGLFSEDLYYRLNTVTLLLNRQPNAGRVCNAA